MDYSNQNQLPTKPGAMMEVSAPGAEPSAPPPPPPSYDEAVMSAAGPAGGYPPQGMPMPQPMPGAQPPVPQPLPGYHHPYLPPGPHPYPQQPVGGPTYYGSNDQTQAAPDPNPNPAPLPVGPKPLKTVCPWCNKDIVTRVEYKNKYSPHICCFLLLASIVCACCSCLPYLFCPKERDEHFCPKCDASLGAYVHRR